ncbi:hypothetical protein CROQUDRAFT_104316 [Cronartium quercuum f. sp. fusiforme G11]|uniref:Heme haloperoxidase family profile domain-containing protein n=1 Tax=Cronartium quercuum f. sp. fusiforme G11 TaxID=708437 RepID=A0A9P6NU46_9BASI|nr:hypothetical protein CROQUDRAFT_104316 [Cronartium quercuum f. sp. fusiforme G11]
MAVIHRQLNSSQNRRILSTFIESDHFQTEMRSVNQESDAITMTEDDETSLLNSEKEVVVLNHPKLNKKINFTSQHQYRRRKLGCPCPAIAILANHSYITPKNAEDPIPFYQLIYGLVYCFNISFLNAIFLTFTANILCGNGWSTSMAKLGAHNKIEHDGSLTRYDSDKGDSLNPSPERIFNFLQSASKPNDRLTLKDFARQRILVEMETETTRSMTRRGILTTLGEYGLVMSVFGKKTSMIKGDEEMGITAEWFKTIYLDEKLPSDYSPPDQPVTVFKVFRLGKSLHKMMKNTQSLI